MKKKFLGGMGINIILLGLVSLLADTSSHIILPILPMFIVALGGTGLVVGLIGGLGDAVASILKVLSGYWSDRLGKRKPLVYAGYTTSALAKLFFPLSAVWHHLLLLRPLERVGKGLRDAPRDAMIASYVGRKIRGRGFGLHRALDTSGAILGSILAFALFWFLALDFRPMLAIAAGVAFLALIPLYFVKEVGQRPRKLSLRLGLAGLPKPFKLFVLVATIFALGNFTYMFFMLRAGQLFTLRLAVAIPIALYILYNIARAGFSMPAGMLSDRIGRRAVLILGYALFGLTCLGFAFVKSLAAFVVLFILYGIVFGLVDGVQRAFASDLATPQLRGTALGTFHTATGLAALPAGIIAGALWQIGPALTFIYGAVLGLAAAALLTAMRIRG